MYLAQFVMGAALARQQAYPQAIEYLRRAIELQPDSTWAHYEMGLSLLNSGDYTTAVVHLEIASSRLPEFAAAHPLLAQAYDHLGRAEDARRERSRSSVAPAQPYLAVPGLVGRLRNNTMSITLVDLCASDVYYFPMVTNHISTPCTCPCCRTCCRLRGHGDGM